MADMVLVAAIAGAFGVNGEVRLKSFTADPQAVADYGPLYNEAGNLRFEVTLKNPINNGFSARLSGVATKEQADALRGTKLFAPRDALPALADDEFYHTDLIGMTVVDAGGKEKGIVKAVLNHGAGDLLEVDQGVGQSSVLVPFTSAIAPTVDLKAKRIVVDPPDGLFE